MPHAAVRVASRCTAGLAPLKSVFLNPSSFNRILGPYSGFLDPCHSRAQQPKLCIPTPPPHSVSPPQAANRSAPAEWVVQLAEGDMWTRTADAVQSWLSDMELKLKQQESTTRRKRRQVKELQLQVNRGEVAQEQLQVGPACRACCLLMPQRASCPQAGLGPQHGSCLGMFCPRKPLW